MDTDRKLVPSYNPYGIVMMVQQELAKTGVKTRYTSDDCDLHGAFEAAELLLRALGVEPVVEHGE